MTDSFSNKNRQDLFHQFFHSLREAQSIFPFIPVLRWPISSLNHINKTIKSIMYYVTNKHRQMKLSVGNATDIHISVMKFRSIDSIHRWTQQGKHKNRFKDCNLYRKKDIYRLLQLYDPFLKTIRGCIVWWLTVASSSTARRTLWWGWFLYDHLIFSFLYHCCFDSIQFPASFCKWSTT